MLAADDVGLVCAGEHGLPGVAAMRSATNWFGEAEGHVYLFAVDGRTGSPRLIIDCLERALVTCAEMRGFTRLRLSLPWHDRITRRRLTRGLGWRTASIKVHKSLSATAVTNSTQLPIVIRSARPDDAAFVRGLIAQAIENGLSPGDRTRYSEAALADAASRFLGDVLRPDLCLLVAECGDRIGHAVANLATDTSIAGECEAVLHDAFTLPAFRHQGVAAMLVAAVEHCALQFGRRGITGTVTHNTDARKVLKGLRDRGWWPAEIVLERPLYPRIDRLQ
jgi:GNAT superfamily N-acetyltransferase